MVRNRSNRQVKPSTTPDPASAKAAQRFNITVDILDVWHAGSGRGAGHRLDAIVVRDAQGLPYLPGRHLRGLLREAAECIETWGHAKEAPKLTDRLFGARRVPDQPQPAPGTLKISNAVLLPQVQAWFHANPEAIQELFISTHHTATDGKSGTAKAKSLRGIELVVPLTLHAEMTSEQHERAYWSAFKPAFDLVRNVGAMRHRGYGRASLTVEAEK